MVKKINFILPGDENYLDFKKIRFGYLKIIFLLYLIVLIIYKFKQKRNPMYGFEGVI